MASVGTLKARRERAPDAPEDDPMSEAVTISPILDDWSTRRLLVGWREGQRAAGRELFVRHYEKIYRFFDSKIKRNVQELVEGTFRDCLELASTEVEVRVSLLTFATHRLYDHFKFEHVLESFAQTDPSQLSLQELGGHPSTMIDTEPDLLLLREAIPRIPLGEQLLLELLLDDDSFSLAQLARILGLEAVTMDERVGRARAPLERELQRLDRDEPVIEATRRTLSDKLLEALQRASAEG